MQAHTVNDTASEGASAPTPTSAPDLLRPLLDRVKAKGTFGVKIGPETLAACRRRVKELDAALKPAPRPKVMARICTLLAHYWTPDLPAEMQEVIARDWGDVLADLPWGAIEAAATEWLTQREARPTPAAFRKLAIKLIDEDWGDRAWLKVIIQREWR